jgi:CheY-like chemotaxis protein
MSEGHLILLVDDIPDHVVRYEAALVKHGFEVHLAQTGEHALKLARGLLPDCAVVDLRLPDMSGWEVCEELKKTSKPPRVVVLTPEVSKMCAQDSTKVGCHAWLAHPSTPEHLVHTIKQVMRMETTSPQSPDEALIGMMVCSGCGSDRVKATLRVGPVQYYCCTACGFCWRAETLVPA